MDAVDEERLVGRDQLGEEAGELATEEQLLHQVIFDCQVVR